MTRPHKLKIERGQQLREDAARMAWLRKDEQECIREIEAYKAMRVKYAKWPKIVAEIKDEIIYATSGLEVTRRNIRELEAEMRRLKRIGDN